MEQIRTHETATTLAGFRVVRRIGSGSRSTVYLGQAGDGRGEIRTTALKVFRQNADRAAVDREVRALLAAPRPMLAYLRDVATTPDGRSCLVMDRLAGPSLERLLAERGRIMPGELVTVAATITAALQALHDAGFSHSMIGPDCIRFDARGRPVLLGLGALDDLPTGGAGAARRRDDLVRLAGWVRSVMEHLEPRAPEAATAESVLAVFDAAATARPLPPDLTQVEAALFAWVPATAVHGAVPGTALSDTAPRAGTISPGGTAPPGGTVSPGGTASPGGTVEPGSAIAPAIAVAPAEPTVVSGRPATTLTRPARPAEPAVIPALSGRAGAGVARQGPAGRTRFRSGLVRAEGWAGARWTDALATVQAARRISGRPLLAGVCVAVILTTGILWGLSRAASPDASGESGGPLASRPATDGAGQFSAGPDDDARAESAEASTAIESLIGDDPAAATLALLELREQCLVDASVLCLDGVDQPGSVAMAADSYRVRQASGDPEGASDGGPSTARAPTGFTATIQERRGNAALILLTPTEGAGNTQPASALVIKGEAGWRLRELFEY